ncbi:ferritin-like domain-containing protein [Pseudomonas saliphila]|uniref:ferritin-like domain-containing protein n=1 Tax=Pseudomonas saliphila TaxID=2586906 RepID=UPI00123B81E0|nr:ferritin-like domain-containing protein [Pseudomonas saliphila]
MAGKEAKVDNLVDWLRDAHAMEQQAESMLKAQSSRLEHYPELKARIDQHIEETLGQQKLLDECLARLNTSPSTIKDIGGKLMAFSQGASGMFVSDEVVKGAMAGYVFEHMEIASYTVLIAAAKAVGDLETQRACEQILPQEEAMADWLKAHLPELTQAYLTRDANPDMAAKR